MAGLVTCSGRASNDGSGASCMHPSCRGQCPARSRSVGRYHDHCPLVRSKETVMIVTAGQSAASAVAQAGLPTTGPKAIVVVRDPFGQLRDLDSVFQEDTEVE